MQKSKVDIMTHLVLGVFSMCQFINSEVTFVDLNLGWFLNTLNRNQIISWLIGMDYQSGVWQNKVSVHNETNDLTSITFNLAVINPKSSTVSLGIEGTQKLIVLSLFF